MLNERFLARLDQRFPSFYARVDEEARSEAARFRIAAQGDLPKALARARLQGAARLWWPYVKGSVPLVHRDAEAMEAFTRLVLTVDHIVGHEPGGMDQARTQVLSVLRNSLDVERLKELIDRREKDEAKAAFAGVGVVPQNDAGKAWPAGHAGLGLMASVTALMAPVTLLRNAHKWSRWLPGWGKVAAGAIVVGALASVPFVAGYSAGRKAEDDARGATGALDVPVSSVDIKRAA